MNRTTRAKLCAHSGLAGVLLALAGCGTGSAEPLVHEGSIGQGARLDGGLDPSPVASQASTDTSAVDTATSAVAALELTAVALEGPVAPPPSGPAAELEPPVSAPASAPGEPLLVKFLDLSLIGLDVDAIFDPAEGENGLADLPATIRALDRRLVAIEGFMIPMEWEGTRVKAFMLVRDMAGCCFGQMPQPDEWVEVLMQEGELADYYPYVPVLATGVFELAGETDDMGYVTGAYRLRGEGVTDEW